jgi:type II secretory pathway pseudopilin PulG
VTDLDRVYWLMSQVTMGSSRKQSGAERSEGERGHEQPQANAPSSRRKPVQRGLGAVEVVVVAVIVALVGLAILASLPRHRELARSAGCQANLMQIGRALALYQQSSGQLPTVPPLGSTIATSPLAAMLGELGLSDFTGLKPSQSSPEGRVHVPVVERPLPGLTCPSDTLAVAGIFPAPISYRATTGDRTGGQTGPFAPGRLVTIADVEAGDGLAYTAAFAERLVGNHQPVSYLGNYALVPGPVSDLGCPRALDSAWQGDAGSSWLTSGWRSTLYNHVLTPNATLSCVATDRRSAAIGASSHHPGRVYVLLLDGGVRAFTPRVDTKIWRALANFDDSKAYAAQPR